MGESPKVCCGDLDRYFSFLVGCQFAVKGEDNKWNIITKVHCDLYG